MERTFLERAKTFEDDNFCFDTADPLMVAAIRTDYLEDLDNEVTLEEAELVRLQLGMLSPLSDPNTHRRIFELQKLLGVKQTLTVRKNNLVSFTNNLNLDRPTRNVRRNREVRSFHEMYFEKPLGMHYTKATLYIEDMDHFDLELRSQPVVEMVLYCARVEQVKKYLQYRWLHKVQVLELNNFHCYFSDLAKLFENTTIKPKEIKFTGNNKASKITMEECILLKLVSRELSDLKKISWADQVYNFETNKFEKVNGK